MIFSYEFFSSFDQKHKNTQLIGIQYNQVSNFDISAPFYIYWTPRFMLLSQWANYFESFRSSNLIICSPRNVPNCTEHSILCSLIVWIEWKTLKLFNYVLHEREETPIERYFYWKQWPRNASVKMWSPHSIETIENPASRWSIDRWIIQWKYRFTQTAAQRIETRNPSGSATIEVINFEIEFIFTSNVPSNANALEILNPTVDQIKSAKLLIRNECLPPKDASCNNSAMKHEFTSNELRWQKPKAERRRKESFMWTIEWTQIDNADSNFSSKPKHTSTGNTYNNSIAVAMNSTISILENKRTCTVKETWIKTDYEKEIKPKYVPITLHAHSANNMC